MRMPKYPGRAAMGYIADIDEPMDRVDIVCRSKVVPPIVDQALILFPDLQTVWMQIGLEHTWAGACGLTVIKNRYLKTEYRRLFWQILHGWLCDRRDLVQTLEHTVRGFTHVPLQPDTHKKFDRPRYGVPAIGYSVPMRPKRHKPPGLRSVARQHPSRRRPEQLFIGSSLSKEVMRNRATINQGRIWAGLTVPSLFVS